MKGWLSHSPVYAHECTVRKRGCRYMSAETKNVLFHIFNPCNNPEETCGHFHDQVYLRYFLGNPEHWIQALPLNDAVVRWKSKSALRQHLFPWKWQKGK